MNLAKSIPNVSIPEGQIGDWKVEKFNVSEAESTFTKIRAIQHPREYVPAGVYTRLKCRNLIVMSDTPTEKQENLSALLMADGRKTGLINGLGIGMISNAILLANEHVKLDIVEKSKEVIDLVAPHYDHFGDRFNVIHADAFEYGPEKKYNFVWHDIWNTICEDNLEEFWELYSKYQTISDVQSFWGLDHLAKRSEEAQELLHYTFKA